MKPYVQLRQVWAGRIIDRLQDQNDTWAEVRVEGGETRTIIRRSLPQHEPVVGGWLVEESSSPVKRGFVFDDEFHDNYMPGQPSDWTGDRP